MRPPIGERGFTLAEVLVAGLVLVVGVLATVALVSAATDQTARNLGEEAGNSLAREITEVAHHAPFAQLQDSASAALAIRPLIPGSGASGGASWTVTRRNREYAVSVDACRILATGSGACTTPSPDPGAGGGGVDQAVLVNVLGLAGVDLTGGVPNALCGVFGPGFDLSVLPLVGVGAETCGQLGAQASVPGEPPDLARLSVTVSWDDRGRARQVTHTALVVDPATMAATT